MGLDVGVYYYTYATTVAGAKTDAQNTLNWIKGKKFEYPIYFDYEDACQNGLSQTTAKNICLTYMDMIADAGYLTGMYTGYYKSTQIPLSSICSKYEFWVAHYYNNTYTALGTKYSTYSGMYQYSCEKYVGGMGPYDANVCYKDYPAIVKKYGFNGYTATTSSGLNSGSTSGSTTTTTVDMPTKLATLDNSFTANIKFGKATSMCLGVNGTNVALYTYTTTSAKQWKFEKQSDGSYKITNVRYNMCLGVVGDSASSAGVKIAEESTAAGQRWFIYEVDGKYVFNPACSENTVLTVKNGSSTNSTRMQTLTYKEETSQLFNIVKVCGTSTKVADLGESFTATVNNVNSKKNLSVSVPSNDAIIFEVTTNKVQQWKFDRQSDGSYKITNVRYNMCLGVVGNSASSAGVKIAEESTAAGQRWFIYEIDGKYIFSPACSEITVLAVKNSSIVNSTRMCTIAYNADPAQFFDIVKISN